ncbi:MAG: hypothetical protein V3T53_09285 [Phycisphaerales bacterium]
MQGPQDQPTHPPTEQSEMLADDLPTKWPTVIGVISLFYALGGLLCQIGVAMGPYLTELGARLGGLDLDMEIPASLMAVQIGLATLTFCVGILMFIGAVNLLRRRRSGPSLLRVWSVIRLVLIVVGLGVAVMLAPAQVGIERWQLDVANEKHREAGRADRVKERTDDELRQTVITKGVIASGVGAMYPFFLGLWLSRRKVTEEVKHWK